MDRHPPSHLKRIVHFQGKIWLFTGQVGKFSEQIPSEPSVKIPPTRLYLYTIKVSKLIRRTFVELPFLVLPLLNDVIEFLFFFNSQDVC